MRDMSGKKDISRIFWLKKGWYLYYEAILYSRICNRGASRQARGMTAIEYLRRYETNRLKKSSARNEWELTDHESFKINEVTSKYSFVPLGSGV